MGTTVTNTQLDVMYANQDIEIIVSEFNFLINKLSNDVNHIKEQFGPSSEIAQKLDNKRNGLLEISKQLSEIAAA